MDIVIVYRLTETSFKSASVIQLDELNLVVLVLNCLGFRVLSVSNNN